MHYSFPQCRPGLPRVDSKVVGLLHAERHSGSINLLLLSRFTPGSCSIRSMLEALRLMHWHLTQLCHTAANVAYVMLRSASLQRSSDEERPHDTPLVTDEIVHAMQHVVILGTGAFGLEALEAADRAGAKSITMISRERDRWEVAHAPVFRGTDWGVTQMAPTHSLEPLLTTMPAAIDAQPRPWLGVTIHTGVAWGGDRVRGHGGRHVILCLIIS